MSQPPLTGQRLGPVEILERLGAGAMGVVYRANHTEHGDVCVKVLNPQVVARGNTEFVRRFHREAKAACRIQHPHVVRGYGLVDAGGLQLLVQEFVTGGDLEEFLKRHHGKIPVHEALRIIREVALGLEAAHVAGMVHRDLKPGNVLLDGAGHAKIADLGLVLQVDGEPLGQTVLTRQDTALGTPYYMAPEQWKSAHDVDKRADIYSLGVMLHECITGKRPLSGASVAAVMKAHMMGAPIPLRSHQPEAPAAIEKLILRMLEKERGDRPGTCSEVVAAVDAIANELGILEAVRKSISQHWTAVSPDESSAPRPRTPASDANAVPVSAAAPARPGAPGAAYSKTIVTPGPQPQPEALVGQVIGGKFEVTAILGSGGMGVVYKARHTLLSTDFAIKVLQPHLAGNPEFRSRFLREAKTMQAFVHQNAVTLRDFGEHEGGLYMALDFAPGATLSDTIMMDGPFDQPRALELARQVLSCLQRAHDAGIVHRDLKPQNLLVEKKASGDHVRVLDFGIAKVLQDAAAALQQDHTLTGTGVSIGTPHYMAPEQEAGDPVDGRTDLYAMGCVLYEIVTGRRPIDAETRQKLRFKIQFETPTPLYQACGGRVSETFSNAVMQSLAKSKDDRPANADELMKMLEGEVAARSTIAAPPAPPSSASMAGTGPAPVGHGAPLGTGAMTPVPMNTPTEVGVPADTDRSRTATMHGDAPAPRGKLVPALVGCFVFLLLAGGGVFGAMSAGLIPKPGGGTIGGGSPPEIALTTPEDGLVTRDGSVRFSGRVDDADAPQYIVILGGKNAPHQSGLQLGDLAWMGAGHPATLRADGRFDIPVPIKDGQTKLELLVRDQAGNEVRLARTVIRDETAPTLELEGFDAAEPTLIGDDVVTVRGRVDDAHGPVTIDVGGAPATVAADGAFEASHPLGSDGTHEVEVVVRDRAGNEARETITVVRDATAPTIILDGAEERRVAPGELTIAGRVDDAHRPTELTIDGANVAVGEDGRFETTWTATGDGTTTVVIAGEDGAGNAGRVELRVTCDGTAPELTIETPTDGSLTAEAEVRIRGTSSEKGASVSIGSGTAIDVDDAGRFELVHRLPAEDGRHVIEVVVTDGVGNERRVEVAVTLDATAPEVLLGLPGHETASPDIVTRDGKEKISIVVRDANPPKSVLFGGEEVPLTDGKATVPLPGGGSTKHEVICVDGAGNRSSRELAVVVDEAKPKLTVSGPTEGTRVRAASVKVTGKVEDDHPPVRLTVGGKDVAVAEDGRFSHDHPVPASDGKYTIRIVAVDRVGNEAAATRSVIRTTDELTVAIDKNFTPRTTEKDEIVLVGRASTTDCTFTVNGRPAQSKGSTFNFRATLRDGDNRFVVMAEDRKTKQTAKAIWTIVKKGPARPWSLVHTLPTGRFPVWGVAWSADGSTIAAAGADRVLRIWNASSGALLNEVKNAHTRGSINAIAFSPKGDLLATAGDDKVAKIWRAPGLEPVATLTGHADEVKSLCWNYAGTRLITGSKDGQVRIWDTKGRKLLDFAAHGSSILSLAFGGTAIATGSEDRTIKWFDADDGRLIAHRSAHAGTFRSIAFTRDGRYVASVSEDKMAVLWASPSWTEEGRIPGTHEQPTLACAFTPNGKILATAGADRAVKFWTVPGGNPTGRALTNHEKDVTSLDFSPDGKRLVTGSKEGVVRIWQLGF